MAIQLSDHFTYRRIIRFALPSVATMIFMSIYGVVDGYFVSNFAGKTSFAAVNLIMPALMMAATVGFMFGNGGTAIVSKTFGEGDPSRANRYFSLFVYVSFALGVFFSAFGIIFMPQLSKLLGASGTLLDDSIVYGRIIMAALPFCILQFLFQSFFVAAEKPQLGFWVTAASGVTNMALDAILVLSLPQPYKLIGAAVATAMSQTVGGLIPVIYFLLPNKSLLRLGKTKLEMRVLGKACLNGSSEFMSNIAMNLVAMLYNFQLLHYAGEDGVSAYGVMMYLSMIFSSAYIGVSVGMAPVVGYHFGAKNKAELHNLLQKCMVIIGILGALMFASAEALAVPLSKLYVGYDADLLALTIKGMRIFSGSFLLMGFAIYASGFFTALSDGLTSALISFLRTLVFQVGAVLLLPLIFTIDGIWYSIIVAELMAVLLSALFLLLKRKKYGY